MAHPYRVTVNRAEGMNYECGPAYFDGLQEAHDQLWAWSHTAPQVGRGYHKVDVAIEWDDHRLTAFRNFLTRSGPEIDIRQAHAALNGR